MENTAIVPSNGNSSVNLFAFPNYERAMEFVNTLSRSSIVPNTFKNNSSACLIALDMANRMRRNPMEVMQAMYVVNGKPGFSSSFLIGLINSCGLFGRLRFEFVGKEGEDGWGCRAWAVEKETGEKLVGPLVTMSMARKEGWTSNKKWQTMPEIMLRYRAASFFSRAYCPDLTGGINSTEELSETSAQERETTTSGAIEAQLLSEPSPAPSSAPQPVTTSDTVVPEVEDTSGTPAPQTPPVEPSPDKDEKMREEIMKIMKGLNMKSDDQAVFFVTHGGSADLKDIPTDGLIRIGKAARAMLDERLGRKPAEQE